MPLGGLAFVDLGLARAFGLPVLVIGDIDRGGILAARVGATRSWRGHPVEAYEIHHGIASRIASDRPAHPFLDGWQSRSVRGTTWHVAFEGDGFRRAWLTEIARMVGS